MSDVELIEGLKRLTYAYLPQHKYLAEGFERVEGPNIGSSGEHLTIMFLSMDRPGMSERLCKSVAEHIPHFKGEILAIDNGSQPKELAELEKMLDELPLRTRLVKMGENFGVAGGRNRGVDHVNTQWVMSVDNDIYFTRDPLRHWQEEIAAIGCRFFSLALFDPGEQTVFLRGGNLYAHYAEGEIHLGGGSAGKSTDSRPVAGEVFLGTCMMGGASIFDVEHFKRMGKFDDNMFVGFEDIEFSVRLFREGYKVGCSALAALVHDHAAPETEVDKAYEQVRFRRNYIEESAAYFEAKHGFKVWNQGVDRWLAEREQALGLESSASSARAAPDAAAGQSPSRPKLLLIPDTDNWAFANISRQIEKHLSDRYDITVVASSALDNFAQIPLMARGMDLVHIFWRPSIPQLMSDYACAYGRGVGFSRDEDYLGLLMGTRVTTAVYDHLFLDGPEDRYGRLLTEFVDGYYTSSNKLDRIYRDRYAAAPPMDVIPDGVDTTIFGPRNVQRLSETDGRPLRVGWVGNSKWAAEEEDFKGLHTIILPALEKLKGEGVEIETHFADRQTGFIPHSEMPRYYAEIDILLCASKIEGTPNPVLEAMACGVPVVSTDVGIVPDALGPMQHDFILPERSVGAMADALRRLDRDRSLLPRLSAENLEQVRAWDWAERVKPFAAFFDRVLAQAPRHKPRLTE
ncbi:glycosyltransferase [Brevundimonas sp. 2R-24]|uniref:Glycosyltransferase n=1 Tax=Peiella sedimenti TaxID=3061083 RepID=A0ABT8SKA8_9CAUL|nr:glycosyltransferase [Caulobacteraceae bacterium XZ-24]